MAAVGDVAAPARSPRAPLAARRAWDVRAIEAALRALVDELGVKPKEVFQPIRVALTGTTVSPGIFESVAALGREETLARLDKALQQSRIRDRLDERPQPFVHPCRYPG